MPERELDGAVFARDVSAITRRLADETVIVPLRNNVADLTSIYTLNETGSFVWELLDGTRDLDEVCHRLVQAFAVDPTAARRDVLDLVADLAAEGLIAEKSD